MWLNSIKSNEIDVTRNFERVARAGVGRVRGSIHARYPAHCA